MYHDKKIAAVIPARKGSKGIPNKNIIDLNGHPLISYSILSAIHSEYIDHVIVSTDSEQIAKIAIDYGAVVKGLRPDHLSSDSAILYDVLTYEVMNHELMEQRFDIMVLLQPTSPLRRTTMIDEALADFVDKKQKSAVSVSEVEEHPVFMRTVNEKGVLEKLIPMESTVRRQELPVYYKVNGMLYINYIRDLMSGYVSLNDNESPIIIPKEFDVDIDTMRDLQIAKERLK